MRTILAAFLAFACTSFSAPVAAQAPAATVPKLIRLVVPFAPGASNDVVARAIGPVLARRLDTTIVVENKAGAGGAIGADFVAKSPHDGSVLLLTSSSLLTAAATQPQLPFDPLAAFAPVAMIGQGPMLLAVGAATPFKTTADLLGEARSRPGALSYGSAGVGSIGHLSTELMDAAAKVQMKHVPYRGAAPAALDLASGHIEAMISNYSTLAPLIKSGKVRPLAVTSGKPHPAFRELPPVSLAAPGFAVELWVGVLAPAGTPQALVDRLNREINDIAASPELAAILEPDGTVPTPITPAAFAARVREELGQWKQIATEKKIVAE